MLAQIRSLTKYPFGFSVVSTAKYFRLPQAVVHYYLIFKFLKFPIAIASFFIVMIGVVGSSFLLYQRINHTKELNTLVKHITTDSNNPRLASLYAEAAMDITDIVSSITASDARGVLVDRFLAYYNSPMKGSGADFVDIADRYGLDYRLLPAIALHESALGKRIPKDSFNAWGWAVYTGQNSGAEFDSWAHGIETVAKGLRRTYVDDGLITPEKIQPRYAPPSSSWANGVRAAMNQISEN